jgi:tetratricopeptide (TPR) repeat protein
VDVDPYLVLLFVLLLFVLLFGAASLLRREPLSGRWAVEVLLSGGVILVAARIAQAPPLPILFFVALYLLTMRARLLIDAGNLLASRGRLAFASRLYALALRLATSPPERLMVLANQSIALLQTGHMATGIAALEGVLSSPACLGAKLEAACRCNLGVAYIRQGQVGRGRALLHETVELAPTSAYASRALSALQRLGASADDPVPE